MNTVLYYISLGMFLVCFSLAVVTVLKVIYVSIEEIVKKKTFFNTFYLAD